MPLESSRSKKNEDLALFLFPEESKMPQRKKLYMLNLALAPLEIGESCFDRLAVQILETGY